MTLKILRAQQLKFEYRLWCEHIRQVMPAATYDEHRYLIDAITDELHANCHFSTSMLKAVRQYAEYVYSERWLPF